MKKQSEHPSEVSLAEHLNAVRLLERSKAELAERDKIIAAQHDELVYLKVVEVLRILPNSKWPNLFGFQKLCLALDVGEAIEEARWRKYRDGNREGRFVDLIKGCESLYPQLRFARHSDGRLNYQATIEDIVEKVEGCHNGEDLSILGFVLCNLCFTGQFGAFMIIQDPETLNHDRDKALEVLEPLVVSKPKSPYLIKEWIRLSPANKKVIAWKALILAPSMCAPIPPAFVKYFKTFVSKARSEKGKIIEDCLPKQVRDLRLWSELRASISPSSLEQDQEIDTIIDSLGPKSGTPAMGSVEEDMFFSEEALLDRQQYKEWLLSIRQVGPGPARRAYTARYNSSTRNQRKVLAQIFELLDSDATLTWKKARNEAAKSLGMSDDAIRQTIHRMKKPKKN